MTDEIELKQALISKDIDTVVAMTGLSFEAAIEKCERASELYENSMGCIRAGQDSSFFDEQLSDLAKNLLSKSR